MSYSYGRHLTNRYVHIIIASSSSVQVCRREGKELLSFIERLAGTSRLKIESEDVQNALNDAREEVQRVEIQATESLHERRQLQPQAKFRDRTPELYSNFENSSWICSLGLICLFDGQRVTAPSKKKFSITDKVFSILLPVVGDGSRRTLRISSFFHHRLYGNRTEALAGSFVLMWPITAQVNTLLALQRDAAELDHERVGLWQRNLAFLR